jgi:signal transduction histidine kinase
MGSRQSLRDIEPSKQPPHTAESEVASLLPNDAGDVMSALLRQLPSVSLLDTDLRFIAADGKALACCGCSADDLAGKPFGQFLPPATAAYVNSRYQFALAGEQIDFEFPFRGNTYAIHADPIANERGDITAILAIAHDLTEQRRAARAQQFLANANELLISSPSYEGALAAVARLAVPHQADWCLVGMQTCGQYRWLAVANADPALAAKAEARLITLGRIPTKIARLLTSDRPTLIENLTEAQLRNLTTREGYLAALRDLSPSSAIFAPLNGRDGNHGGFMLVTSHDGESGRRFGEADLEIFAKLASVSALVVENGQLGAEVAEQERRLRELIEQLLTVHEEERRHFACDVHDQLAQVAASAYQHLQALADRYHPRSATTKADLEKALELSKGTLSEARRILAGLRPVVLDDFGLVTAVGRLLDDLRAAGWEATYRTRLGSERFPPALETALFRVAQEALVNVRKHAGPARVRVTLNRSGPWVSLEVRDWGRGFDTHAIPPAYEPGTHLGLVGMHDRMSQFGGRCDVSSRPGKGTRVTAKVPLSPPVKRTVE